MQTKLPSGWSTNKKYPFATNATKSWHNNITGEQVYQIPTKPARTFAGNGLPFKYCPLPIKTKIGNGTYGIVYSAIETTTSRHVVLKHFQEKTQNYVKAIIRELQLLRELKNDERFVQLLDVAFLPETKSVAKKETTKAYAQAMTSIFPTGTSLQLKKMLKLKSSDKDMEDDDVDEEDDDVADEDDEENSKSACLSSSSSDSDSDEDDDEIQKEATKKSSITLQRGIYAVLESVDHDLSALLKAKYPFTPSQKRCIAYQIINAIHHLHTGLTKPVLHGDIKLSNILITERMQVKICDFGLSQVYHKGKEKSRCVFSYGYQPPELMMGMGTKFYSISAEIWALGCTLFALFTSRKNYSDWIDNDDEDSDEDDLEDFNEYSDNESVSDHVFDSEEEEEGQEDEEAEEYQYPNESKKEKEDATKRKTKKPRNKTKAFKMRHLFHTYGVGKDAAALVQLCLTKNPTMRPSAATLLTMKYFTNSSSIALNWKNWNVLDTKNVQYRGNHVETTDWKGFWPPAPPLFARVHRAVVSAAENEMNAETKTDKTKINVVEADTTINIGETKTTTNNINTTTNTTTTPAFIDQNNHNNLYSGNIIGFNPSHHTSSSPPTIPNCIDCSQAMKLLPNENSINNCHFCQDHRNPLLFTCPCKLTNWSLCVNCWSKSIQYNDETFALHLQRKYGDMQSYRTVQHFHTMTEEKIKIGTSVEIQMGSALYTARIRKKNTRQILYEDQEHGVGYVDPSYLHTIPTRKSPSVRFDTLDLSNTLPSQGYLVSKETRGIVNIISSSATKSFNVIHKDGYLQTNVKFKEMQVQGTSSRRIACAVELAVLSGAFNVEYVVLLLRQIIHYQNMSPSVMILLDILKSEQVVLPNLLYEAAGIASERLVRMFLNAGMDPSISLNGKTPAEVAKDNNNGGVAKILEQRVMDILKKRKKEQEKNGNETKIEIVVTPGLTPYKKQFQLHVDKPLLSRNLFDKNHAESPGSSCCLNNSGCLTAVGTEEGDDLEVEEEDEMSVLIF